LNNFPEKWVLALRFDHPAHPPVSIPPNPILKVISALGIKLHAEARTQKLLGRRQHA
jgi:hypothetical protein